jgi:pseudouridine kinase
LDTNLNVSVINYALNLVKSKNIKTIINAVSIKKAKKLLHVIENIDFLTMNFIELESITGKNLDFYERDAIKDKLKDNFPNVSNIIVTNGGAGIYFVDNFKREIKFFQVDELSETEIVDSNGAGDAFTAGVIYGLYKNENIENCISYGINASRITLKSLKTVADELNELLIRNKN